MSNPNTENYMLGRGSLYAAEFNPSTNTYGGIRHLGNAPEVSITMGVERLDHFSSMSQFKAKDKSSISQVSPVISFTLDEFESENWKMLVYGGDAELVSQPITKELSVTIANPSPGKYYDLGYRNITGTLVTIGTVTGGPFVVGTTLTGGTSSATGKIIQLVGSTKLIVSMISGQFQVGETLTSGAISAPAVSVSEVKGLASVKSTSGSTYYASPTDFSINPQSGQIKISDTSTIAGSITVTFDVGASTYRRIKGLAGMGKEYMVLFVSDNPEGKNYELKAWRVAVAPDGDTALIGNEWATMQFKGEIFRDTTNHPDSPYFDLMLYD